MSTRAKFKAAVKVCKVEFKKSGSAKSRFKAYNSCMSREMKKRKSA